MVGVLVAVSGLLGSVTYAHHSFSRDYHEDQSTSIEGVVEDFQYRNPHAILRVRAAGPQGAEVSYAAEWAGAGRLGRQGITAETLKPGDVVRVTGSPGRVAADYRIHLKQIVRPADGWTWGNGRNRRR